MTGRIGVNPGCPYCHPLAAAGHRAGVWMWSILRHAVPVILEHALLPVKPGEEAAIESAFAEAKAVIAGTPGSLALTLSRCLERPNTYLLLVEWDRLMDHTEGMLIRVTFLLWVAWDEEVLSTTPWPAPVSVRDRLSRPRRRPCRTAFMQPNPHRHRPHVWSPLTRMHRVAHRP
jgi:hypothetical protein